MIKSILAGLTLFTALLSFNPLPTLAASPYGGVDCDKARNKESAICNTETSTDPISGTNGLIQKIVNIISYVAGVAAVILIIIGGIRYMLSAGDSGAIKKAKDTVMYALIGLAVIVLARVLILFVLDKFYT